MLFICLTKSPSIAFLWPLLPEDYGSGARPSPLRAKARLHSGWQEDWKTTVVPNLPTHTCFPWRTDELLRNTGRTCKLQTEWPRAWGIDPATLWLWGHSTNYHCNTTLIKTQQSSGFQFLLSQKNYSLKFPLKFQNKLLWFQQWGSEHMKNLWSDAVSNRFNLKQMKKSWLCFVLFIWSTNWTSTETPALGTFTDYEGNAKLNFNSIRQVWCPWTNPAMAWQHRGVVIQTGTPALPKIINKRKKKKE